VYDSNDRLMPQPQCQLKNAQELQFKPMHGIRC